MTHTLEIKNKVDALLVLRGFAGFCVVLRHVARSFGPNANILTVLGHNLSWLVAATGALGVWIFFILSGYLMGKGFYTQRYKLNRKSIFSFYSNRLLRIYPLYVVSIIVVWAAMIKSYPLNPENLKTLAHLLLFSYYQETRFPNSLLWTISTEFRFYLLVPLAFFLGHKFLKNSWVYAFVAGAVLVLALANRYFLFQNYGAMEGFDLLWIKKIYIPMHANLDLFLSGLFLNYLVQKRKATKGVTVLGARLRKLIALGLFGAMVVAQNYIAAVAEVDATTIEAAMFYIYMPTLVIFAVGYLIYQFESKSNYHVPAISWSFIKQNPLRVTEVVGILTYGIYLWHMPVLLSFSYLKLDFSNDHIKFVVLLLYTFLLSVAVAAATYFLIEKKFDKLKITSVSNR